jgi:hypothetical protein
MWRGFSSRQRQRNKWTKSSSSLLLLSWATILDGMITLVNLVLLPSSQRKSRSLVYSVWGEITLGWIFFDFFWQDVDRESVSCPGGKVISSKWGRNLWEISLENSRLLKCHSILLNIRERSFIHYQIGIACNQ